MEDLSESRERVRAALTNRIGADLRRRRQRSRRLAAVVITPLVLVAATAGFYILNVTPEQAKYTAFCYSGPSANTYAEEVALAVGGPEDRTGAIDPVELCTSLWLDGRIQAGATVRPAPRPFATAPPAPSKVPVLVKCIREDWRYAVLPAPGNLAVSTEEFCPDVGMRPATLDVEKLLRDQQSK
jgi:hypothetical protein